ncbi:MAG: serine hydrolase [Synechococcaceae cyanobacterium SM2_3_1]|nr:serine hydrolase [Synechococcaceae cyanobacterium SM2_3_1]
MVNTLTNPSPDLEALDLWMRAAFPQVAPAVQVEVRWQGQVIWSQGYGQPDPEHPAPTQEHTCFDVASLTKIITTLACLRLVAAGRLQLDQSLATLLPEFKGLRPLAAYEDPLQPGEWIRITPENGAVEAEMVTVRQILTHTSGLPAWRPLYQQPDRAAALQMALTTPFAARPGDQILYSDVGFILLGLALEILTQQPLDALIQTQVLTPLGLRSTQYASCLSCQQVAPTEMCAWRQRRLRGEVHDENAARLEGVTGHAGIFSTAHEMAQIGEYLRQGSPEILPRQLLQLITTEQKVQGSHRRSLGLALRSAHPAASSYPLSSLAYGHTGFTGTSLWIDPGRALVVACLTNSIYFGREREEILCFRQQLHRQIVKHLPASGHN